MMTKADEAAIRKLEYIASKVMPPTPAQVKTLEAVRIAMSNIMKHGIKPRDNEELDRWFEQ